MQHTGDFFQRIDQARSTARNLVAVDPDVILAPSTHDTAVTVESILQRPGWGQVTAIREKRVHLIDGDKISRCGPRLIDALEEIARVLHPQRFPLGSQRFPTGSSATASGVDHDAVEIEDGAS